MSLAKKEFQVENLTVEIYANKQQMGQASAERVAELIRQAVAQRGHAALAFAAAPSQDEFYQTLRTLPNIPWKQVSAFHLDEYLGLSDQHPSSFRYYLRETLFKYVPLAEVFYLNGDTSDQAAECERYGRLLAETAIDVACIGIGENGHLAFNDPPADFHARELVHVVQLDEACRMQQVGEGHFPSFDAVPAQALSLSIPAIFGARFISCVVPDQRKAEAVRATLTGPITPNCPASILRRHANARLYLDEPAAFLLAEK